MLRKEIYELPELPLVLSELLLRPLLLDGNSGNPAGVIDQLNFSWARLSNFTVKHTERAQHCAFVRHNGRRPGGTQSGSHDQIPEVRKMRVRKHVRDENRLPQVSGCATRPDVRPNTHTVGSDPILVRQFWGGGVSQVLTVLVQKENRAHRSLSVGFDQESDTPQDVVKGCANENHLERIEHRLAG